MGRICFHFHRWTHGSSGRRPLYRITSGCPTTKNWVLPTILRFLTRVFGDIGLLFQLFHVGQPTAVTLRDPDELPVPIPSGHRHYAGQKEALQPLKILGRKRTTRKVCACVTKLSLNNASCQRKWTESNMTQRSLGHLQTRSKKNSSIVTV